MDTSTWPCTWLLRFPNYNLMFIWVKGVDVTLELIYLSSYFTQVHYLIDLLMLEAGEYKRLELVKSLWCLILLVWLKLIHVFSIHVIGRLMRRIRPRLALESDGMSYTSIGLWLKRYILDIELVLYHFVESLSLGHHLRGPSWERAVAVKRLWAHRMIIDEDLTTASLLLLEEALELDEGSNIKNLHIIEPSYH